MPEDKRIEEARKNAIKSIKEGNLAETQTQATPQDSEKEELSKEDAIYLLKEGFSTKDILENYPGAFTDYQLRGYKAAVSRGYL